MPVVQDDTLFVAGGGDWFWGKNSAWLKWIALKGSGDVTATAHIRSAPLGRHTMATPAVHNGLVFATDSQRNVHCIDATTGAPVWTQELGGEIWASTLIADGKVYVGTRRGDFWVLAESREKQVLSKVELGAPISATAVAANGTLYVSTGTHLYAVQTSSR
jgi:outer membrane protein assembly factor BamB